MNKPEFLRKKVTEEKFVYSDALMARGDMVAYFPEGDKGSNDDYIDPNKIQMIVEAIDKLPKIKGFTLTGVPKTKLLVEILDMSISPAERDEAFELYKLARDDK